METIVDIATDGRHLSVQRGFLVVSQDRVTVGRVPLDDVAAVIVHAHGITWSTNLMVALAERGAVMVICAANHAPVAVCLPIDGHHTQNAHIRAQWDAGKPLVKQLWRRVVIAKIAWQAAVLAAHGVADAADFAKFIRKVGPGDAENVEAQAARRYWPLLMGDDFRRDRGADDANALLNYGYTVVRSLVARSVVAAGLHPSIGIHHANRGNAFALADDLIEPLRPLVDSMTKRLQAAGITGVTAEAKRAFTRLIALDLPGASGTTTVTGAAARMAQSLADCFLSGRADGLILPQPPTALELAGLDALIP